MRCCWIINAQPRQSQNPQFIRNPASRINGNTTNPGPVNPETQNTKPPEHENPEPNNSMPENPTRKNPRNPLGHMKKRRFWGSSSRGNPLGHMKKRGSGHFCQRESTRPYGKTRFRTLRRRRPEVTTGPGFAVRLPVLRRPLPSIFKRPLPCRFGALKKW